MLAGIDRFRSTESFGLHFAELGPLAVVLARLDGGGDELDAFYAVGERWKQRDELLAATADDLGELAVEGREGFEVALGMTAGDADVHRWRPAAG